jgi:ribose 5-phosphate isomerase A
VAIYQPYWGQACLIPAGRLLRPALSWLASALRQSPAGSEPGWCELRPSPGRIRTVRIDKSVPFHPVDPKPSFPRLEQDALKAAAAARALELVRPGMLVGLGTGTTARYFVEGIGDLVAQGLPLTGVPTSRAVDELARQLGIQTTTEPVQRIDLAVDGADEVDPNLGLIKGRGGALTREKLVATAARVFVVIVDESKLVSRLGRGTLPVEVVPFLWRDTADRLRALGATCELRRQGEDAYLTDNGNLILDLQFGAPISDATHLAERLERTVGVVEHGLFLGLAKACIVAGATSVGVIGSLAGVEGVSR